MLVKKLFYKLTNKKKYNNYKTELDNAEWYKLNFQKKLLIYKKKLKTKKS